MASFPLWLLLAIFVVAAAVVWIAGVQLSRQTDVLSTRLHLGEALGGTILLAVATNLPEVAITVSAAVSGDLSVAIGNILGGIAIQTVVLVVLDVAGRKPLTYLAASLPLVVEAGVVIAVLGIAIMGTRLPKQLILAHVTPAGVLIVVAWVVGLLLQRRAGRSMPWHENGKAPGSQDGPRGGSRTTTEQQQTKRGTSTLKSALIFAAAAIATLVAGAVLEISGDAASKDVGLSGILFGATVLALATSLPEISTGLTAVRNGDYELAVSDIFGGNAFLPVLFFVATLISGEAVLPQAGRADVYLTAVGVVLTLVYLFGLLFRPRKQILRMGVDSLVVLIVYLVSVGGLIAITAGG
ncbi:MAG TPA: sodium:calcium antiporter [Amnibacterium sp.]